MNTSSRNWLIVMMILVFNNLISNAQDGQTVNESAANYVDLFTGDFRYSVPLFTISGPNGESFPLSLNYQGGGGVRMEEDASWIGLGWDLPIGEITRAVKGVPDDWKGVTLSQKKINFKGELIVNDSTKYYGPVYFNKFGSKQAGLKTLDIYTSSHLSKGSSFEFPDYDAFFVDAPGLGGEMNLHLFEYGYLHRSNIIRENEKSIIFNRGLEFSYTNRPTFRFKSEKGGVINLPDGINIPLVNTDNKAITYASRIRRPEEALGQTTSSYSGDYTLETNQMWGSNFVEYYTNEQINAEYTDLKRNGFLDYRKITGTRRPESQFQKDGIGAIKITNSSGTTYHFSLPVYSNYESTINFMLDKNDLPDSNEVEETYMFKYASSWKLTAITGIDYFDANNNGVADYGDKGYWIALEYSKWTENYEWTSPSFGYWTNLNKKNKPSSFIENVSPSFFKSDGSIAEGSREIYYLNSIKTASQTAYFFKELKLDGIANNGIPKLKLSKVVLFDNKDLENNPSLINTSILNQVPVNGFSFSDLSETSYNSDKGLINIAHYLANETAIEKYSLKSIDLDQDYKLCPMFPTNKNVEILWENKRLLKKSDAHIINIIILELLGKGKQLLTKNDTTIAVSDVYTYKEIVSSKFDVANKDNTGKLTLNRIKVFEQGKFKMVPDYLFEYSDINPPYDHSKKDYFGYYKSDFVFGKTSNHTSAISMKYVSAWTIKSITSPTGAILVPTFESDEYHKSAYESPTGLPISVNRVFANESFDYHEWGNTKSYTNLKIDNVFGGGLRVKNIEIYEPASKSSYNTRFIYTHGIATVDPDPFDLNIKRELIKSSYSSDRHALSPSVGYTQVKIRPDGSEKSVGEIEFSFHNQPPSFSPTLIKNTYSQYEPPFDCGNAYSLKVFNQPEKLEMQYDKEGCLHIQCSESDFRPILHFLYSYNGYSNVQDPNPVHVALSISLQNNNYIKLCRPPLGLKDLFELIRERQKVPGGSGCYYGPPSRYINYEKVIVGEGHELYGQVSKRKLFDKNGSLISLTENQYSTKKTIEEVFYRHLSFGFPLSDPVSYSTAFIKQHHVPILIGTKSILDGVETNMEFQDHDPLTGIPLTIISSGPTKTLITRKELAYSHPDYSEMGPKAKNRNNWNLIHSPLSEKLYEGTTLLAASRTEWSKVLPVRKFYGNIFGTALEERSWSPVKQYVFNGIVDEKDWKKVSELTLVSENNVPLEGSGISKEKFSGSKLDCNNRYVIAEAIEANYNSFSYCGFENHIRYKNNTLFDGELLSGNAGITLEESGIKKPHTGDFMLKLGAGIIGPTYTALREIGVDVSTNPEEFYDKGIQVGRTYRASVWVHQASSNSIELKMQLKEGSQVVKSAKATKNSSNALKVGDWILLKVEMEVADNFGSINSGKLEVAISNEDGLTEAWVDDFLFYPIDAPISAKVINERTGLTTYLINKEGFYTKLVYDGAGRLISTFVETEAGEKKMNETKYESLR